MRESYQTLDAKLTGRNGQRRKLQNNTYAERRADGSIAVRLHQTDVVTFHPDGRVVGDSGGWKTVTTKARLNEYFPVSVWQRRGQWYLSGGQIWADGITVHADGSITGDQAPSDTEREKRLRKQIAAYCRELVKALPLAKPSGGDCWYCCLREVDTGKPVGECFKDSSHLQSHLDEQYFVPSLVWRALEAAGCKPQGGGCAWFWAAFEKEFPGDRLPVGRMVKRYLHRQFGLA